MLFLPRKKKRKIEKKLLKVLTFVERSSDLTNENISFHLIEINANILVAVFDFEKLQVHFGNFRI